MGNVWNQLEYRPKLQYIYEALHTVVLPAQATERPFTDAVDAKDRLSIISDEADALIEQIQNSISDLYKQYKDLITTNFDDKEKADLLEEEIIDLDGNTADEAMLVVSELKDVWQNLEDFYTATIEDILSAEFPDVEPKDREQALNDTINKLYLKLDELSKTDDLMGVLTSEQHEETIQVATALEDAILIQNAIRDVASIIFDKFAKSYDLLYDIRNTLENNADDMLDTKLVDVIYSILKNVKPFEKVNIVNHIKKLLTAMRLSADFMIKYELSLLHKMRTVCNGDIRQYTKESASLSFMYRNKITPDILHLISTIPDEPNTDNEYMDQSIAFIVDGLDFAEDDYANQLIDYNCSINSSIGYLIRIWETIKQKNSARLIYKKLVQAMDVIQSNSLPEYKEFYTWLHNMI